MEWAQSIKQRQLIIGLKINNCWRIENNSNSWLLRLSFSLLLSAGAHRFRGSLI